MRLTDLSMPEPDLLVVRWRDDFYRTAKARPKDVLLLVEVAQSSLGYDKQFKLPRYARAGINEVWIVNLVDQVIEVSREPQGDTYASQTTHERGETPHLAAFPDVAVTVAEILG
jgi:Uma2 family endonuclease